MIVSIFGFSGSMWVGFVHIDSNVSAKFNCVVSVLMVNDDLVNSNEYAMSIEDYSMENNFNYWFE